ncbi:DUF4870 family protein [Solimicrobium silvestre]|uniref:Putative membrane protein n=1 Tax=Solimicrobium silvestre TaxID=2099400 RepID=A0A2S9GY61_9BURK|nr:hypothetical protein [Solimicrobium silvestre]PRC92596.1 putative membrane protein [Solimicrobium silvestre]
MSQNTSQELVFDSKLESIKNFAWWFYIFHAVSMLFTLGALSFIPVILSYVKRGEAAGTFVYSHHNWQISSFWIYLACVFIGWMLFITIIGIPVAVILWGCAWLWKAYRLIVGIMALNDNQAIGESTK